MKNTNRHSIILAVLMTLVILLVWQVTGGDYYTKYEVVEEVEKELDKSDPLVVAGFYESSTITETVKRNEFRLGLFPTPSGIFDKHSVAVVTLVGPIWLITIALLWYRRRKTATV
jgi:hypothetical protein